MTKKIAKFCQKWSYFWDNLSHGAARRAACPGPFVKCGGCVFFAPIGWPIQSKILPKRALFLKEFYHYLGKWGVAALSSMVHQLTPD